MRSYKELLVVIAGGATLLLMGAAQLADKSVAAQNKWCAANLKSLHQAMGAYQADNDNYFPAVKTVKKPVWSFWSDTLVKYAESPVKFYCPANPKARVGLSKSDGENDLIPQIYDNDSLSYGMNYRFSSSGKHIVLHRKTEVTNPSYTILLGDSKTPQLRGTKWCWKYDHAPRHNGAANYLMVDGHVELMDKSNLGLMQSFEGWSKDVKRWGGSWKK